MKLVSTELVKLIKLWEEGKPLRDIAKMFSTTEEAISNRIQHLSDMGVHIRKSKRHQAKWQDKEMEGEDYE